MQDLRLKVMGQQDAGQGQRKEIALQHIDDIWVLPFDCFDKWCEALVGVGDDLS
jgi:hypothetical protein